MQLGGELAARGAAVTTVALAPGRGEGTALSVPVLGPTRRNMRTVRSLRQRSRDHDIVIAHGSTTLPMCAIALVGAGTPAIYRNIGDPTFWLHNRSRRLRTRWLLRRMAAVVALTSGSAATLSTMVGVPAERISVIPKGVPAERFAVATPAERAAALETFGLSGDRPVALYIGALSPEKNVPSIISAASGLDIDLLVVGGGVEQDAIGRLAAGEDRVHVVGAIADPLPAYHAADVVVLASSTEGLPGVLIEAGLCGVPAVTTDVGYVRDIVDDGTTGVIVGSDDPSILRSGIVAGLDLAGRLGSQAAERCSAAFSMTAVADRWADLVDGLLDEGDGDRNGAGRQGKGSVADA